MTRPVSGCPLLRALSFWLPLAALVLGWVSPAQGQYYFEKNKVQTRSYDFRTLLTAHFQIFYYTGGEVPADYASRFAEDYYRQLSGDLNTTRTERIPVIIYNSQNQFGETNITQDILEEGVGGFTETFKNRVVVPFEGSYVRFRKVLQHEITHVIEYDLFYVSKLASILSLTPEFSMPLWVSEGFAEYASGPVEIENEMFMRDLVISNRLLSVDDLNYDASYISYREGEALFRYLDQQYGRKKVFEFLHELKRGQNVDAAFDKTLGLQTKKFDREFARALRRKYWPDVSRDANFSKIGRLLTDHVADGSVYNTAPALSPSGSMIAFISDRNEYDDVYVISALDGKELAHPVRGERSSGFESVHPYRGGICWAPDEKSIILASKAGGHDVLAQIAYPSGKVLHRFSFGLDGVYTPRFSPDGQRLAFVGLKDGASDIYTYELKSKKLNRVTADVYEDRDPSFSPSGDTIVFVSDRPDSTPWQPGRYAIFAWSQGSAIARLTPRAAYLASPSLLSSKRDSADTLTPDRRPSTNDLLAFVGSDSSYDLCIYSLTRNRIVARSDFLGGVYYPTFSQDGTRLILSYYENVGWDIAAIKDPLANLPAPRDTALASASDTAPYAENQPETDRVKPYKFVLTPDYVVGAAAYGGGSGLSGQLDVALSDVLGNHQFFIDVALLGDITNSDFNLSYYYLRNRLHLGTGVFQYFDYGYLWDYVDSASGLPYFAYARRNLGLTAIASYPLDVFTRLEFSPAFVVSQYNILHLNPQTLSYDVVDTTFWRPGYQLDAAYVFDNTFWAAENAPERGTRARFEAYGTYLKDQKYVTGLVDARSYLKFARRYVFANRLQAMTSLGPNADQFYLGGEDIRGYDYEEFVDAPGTNGFILNTELRSPFVDRLKIAFPLAFDLTNIRAVTFADMGMVWNNRRAPVVYDTTKNRLQDLKLGVGFGFRFQVSYFDLRLDYGYPLSALSRVSATGPERTRTGTWYFGIGTDF